MATGIYLGSDNAIRTNVVGDNIGAFFNVNHTVNGGFAWDENKSAFVAPTTSSVAGRTTILTALSDFAVHFSYECSGQGFLYISQNEERIVEDETAGSIEVHLAAGETLTFHSGWATPASFYDMVVAVGGQASTAHTVPKAYIGVDGVARKLVKTYMGVDGVARLCYGASIPTLKELLASATIDWTAGRNASSTAQVSKTGSTSKYVVSLFNGYASFNRVDGSTKTILKGASTSYGNIRVETGGKLVYASSAAASSYTSVYGATLVGLSFPYDDAIVEQVLSAATLTRAAGRNNRSASTVSGTVTGGLAMLATNTLFTIYDGTEKVLSTASIAGSASSGGTYNLGSVYGGSILKLT